MTSLAEQEHGSTADLAAGNEWVTGIGPFIIGIAVVALLIGVVARRSGRGRSRPPRPEEQPRRSSHRAPTKAETREADDFGGEGERLSPHELRGYGNQGRSSAPQEKRPEDEDNRRGGFGSGGLGG
ncbi:DUF6479 family protein [Streptomyces sp. NBC_01142]|uniref:DUF6479 family protein n=1 Tax=Streptomyces sp. NBC_01142 TaxID=2975865 RepID=UPI00225862C4|nr:DUF6479 family protein [Streptomyces sp. NBC_01142]MCX4821216.1 DUF6479 family protein [Streptomyces sp. NBC_01142]